MCWPKKKFILSTVYVIYPVDHIIYLNNRAQMSIYEREFSSWNVPGLYTSASYT